eukprot:m.130596 g.130596  ORF g.130596 m.130596 type:complete len:389 (+) comp17474_c1_seq1:314-1480(+)
MTSKYHNMDRRDEKKLVSNPFIGRAEDHPQVQVQTAASTATVQRNKLPKMPSIMSERPILKGGLKGHLDFMWYSNQKQSYLEHCTNHDDFTRNGVHYVNWADVILNVSGRPLAGWKFVWMLATTTLVTYICVKDVTGTNFDDGIDKDTLGYLTFGLSLLLVFRVKESYNRYNEARVKWGMMVNRTRDLVRQFWSYCDDVELNSEATRWTVAFVYACKHSLRWKPVCDDVDDILFPEEVQALNAADHMPVYCMERLAECLRRARQRGLLDTQQVYMMDRNITSFEDQIGACERILKTPVPFGLVLHLRWIMILYILCVPLFLVQHLTWGTIPVTLLFAYTLTGLEDISQEIENPFRETWHALPIDSICACIKKNCYEILARMQQVDRDV